MTLPNLISIARLLAVPAILWFMITDAFGVAAVLLVVTALSDAVDGFIAKRFGQESELGRYLDPLADKALLASVFIALGAKGLLPVWLILLAVSRDVLIVGAVILSLVVGAPVAVQPLWVSKANTVAQFLLVGATLMAAAGLAGLGVPVLWLVWLTGALTAASAAAYLVGWIRHMRGADITGGATSP